MIATDNLLSLVRNAVNEMSTTGDDFSTMVDDALISFVSTAAPMLAMEVRAVYQQTVSVSHTAADNDNFYKRRDGRTVARVPVPENFCRFISFFAEGWSSPVGIIHSQNSPLYASQLSSSPGVGSGSAAPSVFLVEKFEDGILSSFIEGHSLPAPSAFTLSYTPVPQVNETQIDMDGRLSGALAYYTASLYLQSINDVNGSKNAFDMARELIVKLNSVVS